jgi:anti-sigma B factor antagonist
MREKSKIPSRLLVAVAIVEDRMQAPDHGHRRKSLSRIHIARESGVAVTISPGTAGMNLEIAIDQVGKDTVVRLSGRIDVDSSPDLRDRLRALLSEEGLPLTIIVDLAEVSYIETSGIATLIEALRIARHHKASFQLRGLSGAVLRLFEVTGVLALFEASNSGQKVS